MYHQAIQIKSHPARSMLHTVALAGLLALSGCGGGGGGGGGGNDKSSKNSKPGKKSTPTAINSPPSATDDFIQVNQDVIARSLSLNATDDDGDDLRFQIVSNGTLGTAVISDADSGTYRYVPNPGQYGTDSFTFSVSDAASTSNTATVTVEINGSPVATGSCNTVMQANQSPGLQGTLSATDPETPTMLSYTLLETDGSDAGLTLRTDRGGQVTITDPTRGTYTYRPDASSGDHRGRDTFRFQVTDPDDAVTVATETVIVTQTVMPLGDSITDGVNSTGGGLPKAQRVGYRQSLDERLDIAGYDIDLVGSRQGGSAASPPLLDKEHEGHRGWTAFEVAWGMLMDGSDGIFAWLDQNPADFVLLHIGTNDLNNTSGDVMDILDEIDRWERSANGNPVTVLLARIIDTAPNTPSITTFNNDVVRKANRRSGDDIVIVNQQTGAGINYTRGVDMSDPVHPTASGYEKMAALWFDELSPLLDKCP